MHFTNTSQNKATIAVLISHVQNKEYDQDKDRHQK